MPNTHQLPLQRIEYVATNRLAPHPENPRTIDENQFSILCKSIRDNPLYFSTRPILCNPQMVVFAGNMRLKAAQHEGMTEVPVAIMDISEEKQREIMIRDNRENGAWDFDKLSATFEPEELIEWGFTSEELEMGDTGGAVDTAGDDDVPEAGVGTPLTVLGDLYEVKTANSTVRLVCGDCTKMDIVGKVMDGKVAHLCVTDPPFNVSYGHNLEEDNAPGYRVREIANDSMSAEDFRQFLRDSMTSMASQMHPGALLYCFMSCKEWGTAMQVSEECGFLWKSTIIWNKSHAVLSRGDYHRKFEPFLFCKKDGAASLCPLEDRCQNDVWDVQRPSSSEQHPTTKPVELYTRSMKNSSHDGDNCIDFFAGSGTGAIAAMKTGRNFFGIELSPVFVDRIVARIHKFSQQNGIDYTITRNGSPFSVAEIGDVPVEERN